MFKILMWLFETLILPQLSSKSEPEPTKEPESKPIPPTEKEVEATHSIDWTNPSAKISKYFSVKEATWLPSWGVLHIPTDEEKANILKVAAKMDLVREFLNEPITVSVWIRPGKANCPGSKWDGQDYNAYIYTNIVWKALSEEEKSKKRIPNSPHKTGDAVDWIVSGKGTNAYCAEIRAKILRRLDEWQIRMEDIDGNWVHIDIRPVITNRFFKP